MKSLCVVVIFFSVQLCGCWDSPDDDRDANPNSSESVIDGVVLPLSPDTTLIPPARGIVLSRGVYLVDGSIGYVRKSTSLGQFITTTNLQSNHYVALHVLQVSLDGNETQIGQASFVSENRYYESQDMTLSFSLHEPRFEGNSGWFTLRLCPHPLYLALEEAQVCPSQKGLGFATIEID